MRTNAIAVTVVFMVLTAACSGGAPKSGSLGLRTVTDVALPGDTSRFDYATLDASGHRLFVSHLGASRIVMVDTDKLTVERTIDNVPSVHGVLVVPALNRLYAAATGSDQAVTYDATSLEELNRVSTGRAPDGLAYDPDTNAVFLSNEAGTTITEIDATTGAHRVEIDVGGEGGNVAYDPTSKHMLVDVQSRGDLVVIDAAERRVLERHALPGCDHDHGLQVDAAHNRAFVACDDNAALLELDLTTFTVTATLQTGADPDVLILDPARSRLYVLAESGVATVIDTSARPATRVARATLADGAHSGAVDPRSHHLYVPIANVSGHPVLRVLAPEGP